MDKRVHKLFDLKYRGVVYTVLAYISIYMLYYPQPLISVFCIMVLYYINKRGIFTETTEREIKFSIVMGIIISISIVWGKNLVEYESTLFLAVRTILLIMALCPFFINVMKIFFTANFTWFEQKNLKVDMLKNFLICWCVIFIAYIPVLLAFYPGIVTYDIYDQFSQVLSGEYNLKHPIAHTMFMGIIFKLVYRLTGDWNKGALVHSIIQMLIMTGVFSYISVWIYKFSKSKRLFLVIIAFWVVLPIHPIFTIVTTKDILFSAIVAILVLKLMESGICEQTQKSLIKIIAYFCVLFFLLFIFRNNALYAVLLFLPALFFYGAVGRKIILSAVLAVIMLFLYNYVLHNYIHALDGPKVEMFSVPVQQIARVYNLCNDNLLDNEKEDIERLFGDEGKETLLKYESRKADVVKERFDQNYAWENNELKYINLWIKWGIKHPGVYLDAWMNLINGYFCFDDEIPDKQTYRTYIEIRCNAYNEMGLHFSTKNKKLFDLYDSLFRKGKCQEIPFLSIVCQLAFYDWALILVFAYVWQKKRYRLLPPIILLLAILFTNLLGPVALLRYIYPFIVCFPTLIFALTRCSRGIKDL
ncbi:MAG: hypothetical protein HFJ07_00135 [Lachnospiraceae bacterium]|nr:hypothetical protein [Lachnospiraceae bacterium]